MYKLYDHDFHRVAMACYNLKIIFVCNGEDFFKNGENNFNISYIL